MKRYDIVNGAGFTTDTFEEEREDGEYIRYEDVEERLDKLEAFVMWIARDWVELSHDKVRIQRDDYIKRAKQLVEELYKDE